VASRRLTAFARKVSRHEYFSSCGAIDDRKLHVSKIAWLLGFHKVSAFMHAFKRWTGKTPPPRHPFSSRPLAEPGLNLWSRIQREYAISDSGGIELLFQLCAATDRAEQNVWRQARRLQRRGDDDGAQFRDLRLELHRRLGLSPAHTTPLYAHPGASPHPPHTMGALTWPMAQELRRRLDAARRAARPRSRRASAPL